MKLHTIISNCPTCGYPVAAVSAEAIIAARAEHLELSEGCERKPWHVMDKDRAAWGDVPVI